MNFRRFVKIIVPMMIIVILSTSCEIQNDSEKTTKPTKLDPVEQELIANPALSRSGALVVAAPDIDSTFNPLFASKDVEDWISDLVFDGLFVFSGNDSLQGVLAKSYVVAEDGIKYTVDLKEGITFQSGSLVKSEDVLFTYGILLDPLYDGKYASVKTHLVSVDKIGEHQIEFTFNSNSRDNLSSFVVPILSKDYYDFIELEDFKKNYKAPMGTGPFSFNDYSLGESIVLVKNTNYLADNAKISGIVIKKYNEADAFKAFGEGKIDIFEISPSKFKVEDVKQLSFGNVMTQGTNITTFIGLDLTNQILNEVKVRQALLYGLDREAFIQSEWAGYSDAVNFIATDNAEYNINTQPLDQYVYNLEKANELLDSSGWKDKDDDGFREKNGERMKLEYTVFPEADWSYNLGQFAKLQWRKLGIEVTLIYLDYNTMIDKMSGEEKSSMWNLAWEITSNQNPEMLFSSDIEKGIYNFGAFEDQTSNEMFDELHEVNSRFERETILKQWHMIQNEMLPVLPIARLKSIWAYNSRVKNLKIDAFASWTQQIENLEIEVLQ